MDSDRRPGLEGDEVFTLTPPCSVNGRVLDGETGAKLNKRGSGKPLGKNVGILECHGNVKNPNITNLYLVADEVNINLDIFCAPMLNWVNRQVNSKNVITVHNSRPVEWAMQFLQKITNPATLGNHVSNRTILGFCTRPGHG
jgi:hypothetical protein